MKSKANKKARPGLKHLFFSLNGRIVRKWWWIGIIASVLMLYLLAMIWGLLVHVVMAQYGLTPQPNSDSAGDIFAFGHIMTTTIPGISLAIYLALVLVMFFANLFAVSSKRLHDLGWSGWWLLAPFIPLLPMMAFTITYETQLPVVLFTISLLAALVLFIASGFLRGTAGPNKYGPNPLAPLTQPTDETI